MNALFQELNIPTLLCFFAVTIIFLALIYFFVGKRRHNVRVLRNKKVVLRGEKSREANTEKIRRLDVVLASIDKRIKFFYYEMGLSLAGFLIWVLAVFVMIRKIAELSHYDPKHEIKNWFHSVLFHFDATGIIIGLIAILVGILIFIAAENNAEAKNMEVHEDLIFLKEASERINEVTIKEDQKLKELTDLTNEIKSYLTLLHQHVNVKERLKEIRTTIEHATANNNQLYVMTYAPNYGQYLVSNLAIIINEGPPNRDWSRATHRDFYWQLMDRLKHLTEDNKTALSHYWKSNSSGRMAILRNDRIDPLNPDTFRAFVRQRVMKNKRILYINPNSKEPIDDPVLTNKMQSEYRNTFVHACLDKGFNEDDDVEVKLDAFIDNLRLNDIELLDDIKDTGLTALDYIPFQFYVSIPEFSKEKSLYYAVIIFTNYYDIGNEKTVVSFSTQSQTICEGLRDMFNGLVKAQDEKNLIKNPIKELFKVNGIACTIQIVLKNVEVTTQQDALITYAEVTPISDIEAKDDLLHLFKLNDVTYSHKIKYIKANEVALFMAAEEKNDSVLFSVGLFFNPLSEMVGQLDRVKSDADIKEHSKLIRFIDMGVGEPKMIEVATKGNVNTGELDFARFDETFYTPKGYVGLWDFAIVTKQKVNQKWIFVGGGIDFYGSKHLIKCFAKENCSEIIDKVKMDEQFAAVFRVGSDDNVTTDLCFLSKIDGEGNVIVVKEYVAVGAAILQK